MYFIAILFNLEGGTLVALLLGPPCETWSSARYEQLLDQQGRAVRGPRPLRGFDDCWGIAALTLRELDQVAIGNSLLLRGLWLCVPVGLRGGAVILEHPAPPLQAERPSVWRTGLFGLLLRDGWLFRRHTFRQWPIWCIGHQTHHVALREQPGASGLGALR